jgi:hypothetical protein
VTFFDPLIEKLKQHGRVLPVAYPDETTTDKGRLQRDAYWGWFSDHWNADLLRRLRLRSVRRRKSRNVAAFDPKLVAMKHHLALAGMSLAGAGLTSDPAACTRGRQGRPSCWRRSVRAPVRAGR